MFHFDNAETAMAVAMKAALAILDIAAEIDGVK